MTYVPPPGLATASKPGLVQLAGDLGGAGTTAQSPVINGYAKATGGGNETVVTNNNISGNFTVNLANGNVFNLTLTGNTTFTFNGATNGKACSFTIYLTQDGTGSRTVTWPGGTKWSGGAPTLSTAGGSVDILVFETLNGGSTWFGSLVGTAFA